MASPFSPAERCKILQIAAIPPGTQCVNVNALFLYPFSNVDTWVGNFFSTGDLGPIVGALDNILNKYTDAVTGEAVRECFDDWDSVKFCETEITAAEGTSGPAVFSASKRRHEIRRYVANLLGFYIPEEGYLHEAEAVLGRSLSEFRQRQGGR
jgi:hypothetical protein